MSNLSNVQSYTTAIHWIGAGANLITGSDQTNRATLGYMLMCDEEAMALAAFTATYPMQPRNPTGSPTVGGSDALQLPILDREAGSRWYRNGGVSELWSRLLPFEARKRQFRFGNLSNKQFRATRDTPAEILGLELENRADALNVGRV